MKKYLLSLCLTMFAFAASWAQGTGRWSIDIATTPVYVEVNGGQVDPSLTDPRNRAFTITTPDGATGYTVEAVEVVAAGKTAGQYATASVTGSGTNWTVSFNAASTTSVGITHFYIQVKNSAGTIVTTTAATPFEVNVYDKTKARILKAPEEYNTFVERGKTTYVPFTLAPVTAAINLSTSDVNSYITIPTRDQWLTDAEKNIVQIPITVSNDAPLGEFVRITIEPDGNPLDRNGNPVQPIEFQVTVAKPELPVKYTVLSHEFKVGQAFTSPLIIDPDKHLSLKEGTDYTVKYDIIPVAGYDSEVFTVDYPNKQNATLTATHTGRAQVKGTFTPTTTGAATGYREWTRTLDVSVTKAQYGMTLTATNNGNDTWSPNAPTITIDPGQDFSETDYTISYSIEGQVPNSATVNSETGLVTITNKDVSQKFYLVAKLNPKNTADFAGTTAKAEISVTGTKSGAYLKKMYDEEKKTWYWEAYLASPSETGPNIVAIFNVESDDTNDNDKSQAALLQMFKDATDIRVKGNINVFNIAQLTHAMGVEETVKYTGDLKTLDMSECQMVGPFTIDGNFPVNGVAVGDDTSRAYNKLSLKNVGTFVFPKPDPAYTVLPAGFHKFFGNEYNPADNNLTSLTITEGWTEIKDGFSGLSKAAHYTTSAMANLTTLKLANSIEKIGAYAFSNLKVQVLTMPSNIHRIDEYAFSPSPRLQDVYFTGHAPEFVHTFAFSGQTQMGNNTVKDGVLKNKVDPEITRYEYYNGEGANKVLVCLLHFPEKYRAEYTDENRVYRRLSKEEVDAHNQANPGETWNYEYSKGYKLYSPEGWTADFLTAVDNRTDRDPNAYTTIGPVDYGAKDQYYGLDMIWPSQNQMSTGYAIAQAGYSWGGQKLRNSEVNGKPIQYQQGATYESDMVDRRGLYQFIISMNNADIDFKFEMDKWYTIALPFDMSVDEIKKVFGEYTQVCRFSKVTRVTDGENKQIKLEFRKSVMGDMTGELDGTNYNDYESPHTGAIGGDADHAEYAGENNKGIKHHFPYMIKPSGTVNEKYVEHEEGADGQDTWHFYGLDFPRISGTLHPEVRRPSGFPSNAYTFAPILSKTKIKVNSYVLVNKDGQHKYAFYKGKKVNGVYEPAGSANQNTAYVQLDVDKGNSDYDIFFKSIDPNAPQSAAKMFSFFGDDEDDAPTAVEKVVIVCGQDQVDNEKIYTINGQLVSGSHLPAGIYIKNGKKYIVK